jgi:hypothetical protein
VDAILIDALGAATRFMVGVRSAVLEFERKCLALALECQGTLLE